MTTISRLTMMKTIHGETRPELEEHDQRAEDDELVGEGVEELADDRDLVQAAGEVAVQSVGEGGGGEDQGGAKGLFGPAGLHQGHHERDGGYPGVGHQIRDGDRLLTEGPRRPTWDLLGCLGPLRGRPLLEE